MSSQIPLISFHSVCLMEKQQYGISDISFKLFEKQKYIFEIENKDTLHCVMGLLEKRYQAERGMIKREDDLFIQSDRMLLEDRVISSMTHKWLGINSDFFYLSGKRKSKRYYIDLLRAKNILYYPVYKLKKEDKIKFVLLALLFQGDGIILINKLLKLQLNEQMIYVLNEILLNSHNLVCILKLLDETSVDIDQCSTYKKISILDSSNTFNGK